MLQVSLLKKFLLFAVLLFALLFSLPNFFPHLFSDKFKKLNLGLDLRGGAHILLEVDFNSFFDEKLFWLKDEVRTILRSENIGYMNLVHDQDKIKFLLRDKNDQQELREAFASNARDLDIKINGDKVAISYSKFFIDDAKRKLLEQSLEIVRRRVDETGLTEPLIQPQGLNRIILQVPGIENPDSLKRILGKTAKLTFHLVHPTTPVANAALPYVPKGYKIIYSEDKNEEGQSTNYVIAEKHEISGEALVDARATYQNGEALVNFKFDSLGAKTFSQITSEHTNKLFAIVLDNKVISAPLIREPIHGGSGVISGNFTIESANELALLLRAGSLPAPLNIIEERTVGPTLGHDSIIAGRNAILIGFLFVVVAMVYIYKIYGIFANVALLVNLLLVISLLSLFQATLTLPGLAGIVLTVGMAVDTNVLIFERIREESKFPKKTIYAQIDNGFSSAFRTIIDSNITTLIAAFMLFNLGSGPVKGFAVTLIIGILTSMFSAISFTKSLLIIWIKKSKTKKVPF